VDVQPRERIRLLPEPLNEIDRGLGDHDVRIDEHEVLVPASLGETGARVHQFRHDRLAPAGGSADRERVGAQLADPAKPGAPGRRGLPLQIDSLDVLQVAQGVHRLRLPPFAVAVSLIELRADEDAHTSSSGSMAMCGCDARLTTMVRPKATSTLAAARP